MHVIFQFSAARHWGHKRWGRRRRRTSHGRLLGFIKRG
jgi:hypothetical protein